MAIASGYEDANDAERRDPVDGEDLTSPPTLSRLKMLRIGLGTSIENVLRALDCEPDLCGVIQFQDSVITRNRGKLPSQSPHKVVITHGSSADAYRSLLSFFKANNKRAKEWSAGLDLDCSDQRTLAALLLNFVRTTRSKEAADSW